jgi:hypothetical protein
MRTKVHLGCLLMPVLALGFLSASKVSLAQPAMPALDELARLKNALQAAGASALTPDQESSIQTLIAEFRDAHPKPVPNTALQNARRAYEDAILNGDNATAAAQALIIGNAGAAETVQRETDAADFAIKLIAILRTGSGQADALIAQMGTGGLVRLALSFAGGPGGPGPRMGRPGPPGFAGP